MISCGQKGSWFAIKIQTAQSNILLVLSLLVTIFFWLGLPKYDNDWSPIFFWLGVPKCDWSPFFFGWVYQSVIGRRFFLAGVVKL